MVDPLDSRGGQAAATRRLPAMATVPSV